MGAADADNVSGSPCRAPPVEAVAVSDSGGGGRRKGWARNWLIPPYIVQDSLRIRRPAVATAASAATALDPPRHRIASESWKQMETTVDRDRKCVTRWSPTHVMRIRKI